MKDFITSKERLTFNRPFNRIETIILLVIFSFLTYTTLIILTDQIIKFQGNI